MSRPCRAEKYMAGTRTQAFSLGYHVTGFQPGERVPRCGMK